MPILPFEGGGEKFDLLLIDAEQLMPFEDFHAAPCR